MHFIYIFFPLLVFHILNSQYCIWFTYILTGRHFFFPNISFNWLWKRKQKTHRKAEDDLRNKTKSKEEEEEIRNVMLLRHRTISITHEHWIWIRLFFIVIELKFKQTVNQHLRFWWKSIKCKFSIEFFVPSYLIITDLDWKER